MNKDLDREALGAKMLVEIMMIADKWYHMNTRYHLIDVGEVMPMLRDVTNYSLGIVDDQRQKDLKAIGFHFGIPVADLEKVLNTREFKDE